MWRTFVHFQSVAATGEIQSALESEYIFWKESDRKQDEPIKLGWSQLVRVSTYLSSFLFKLNVQEPLRISFLLAMEDFVLVLFFTFMLGAALGSFLTAMVCLCCCKGNLKIENTNEISQAKLPDEVYLTRAGRSYHLYRTCQQKDATFTAFKLCQLCLKQKVRFSHLDVPDSTDLWFLLMTVGHSHHRAVKKGSWTKHSHKRPSYKMHMIYSRIS